MLLLVVVGFEVTVVLFYNVEDCCLLVIEHKIVDLFQIGEVVTSRKKRVKLIVVAVRY